MGGHGRQGRAVRLPDERSLNHEIVRAGYAWSFRQYSIAALESEARAAQRGLGADPRS
jgi:endonuclease YncB( thermonuclease family)